MTSLDEEDRELNANYKRLMLRNDNIRPEFIVAGSKNKNGGVVREIINSGIPLTKNFKRKIQLHGKSYFNLSQKYIREANKRAEEPSTQTEEEEEEEEEEPVKGTLMEADILAEEEEEEEFTPADKGYKDPLFMNEIQSATIDSLKMNDMGQYIFETSEEVQGYNNRLSDEINELNYGIEQYGTDEVPKELLRLKQKLLETEEMFEEAYEDLIKQENPTAEMPPVSDQVKQIRAEKQARSYGINRMKDDYVDGLLTDEVLNENLSNNFITQADYDYIVSIEEPLSTEGAEGAEVGTEVGQVQNDAGPEYANVIPQSEYRPKYHLIPIKIMYGTDQNPNWDVSILQAVLSLKITKKEVNKLIDAIVETYAKKLLFFKRKSNGDLRELNEVLQLQYSLERGMQVGARGRKALIDLKDLSALSTDINKGQMITPESQGQAKLSMTQNAPSVGKPPVLIEKQRSNFTPQVVFKPQESSSRYSMLDQDDYVKY